MDGIGEVEFSKEKIGFLFPKEGEGVLGRMHTTDVRYTWDAN